MTVATDRRIHVAEPCMTGNERAYVNDCLDRNWITAGKYEKLFEQEFARFRGVDHAVACTNGTSALHLALKALGVGPGDEVIVPALTYIATAAAVIYCGATPVIVDVDPETWCMDPGCVRDAITDRTTAIVPVDLYGAEASQPASTRVPIILDAAEAHFGRQTSAVMSCFSFYGNKQLTAGEGGMVTTDDSALAERLRYLRGHGTLPGGEYKHGEIGFNYRMSDLNAAIGLAQVEECADLSRWRHRIYQHYLELLPSSVRVQRHSTSGTPWMVAVKLPGNAWVQPVRNYMSQLGIETRRVFPPLDLQPALKGRSRAMPCPSAAFIHYTSLVLPTHANLTRDDVAFICESLDKAIRCT